MPILTKRSSAKKIIIHLQIFSRHYPAVPYIIKWLIISTVIGICAGTASAGFLQSLDWVTNFRENHLWIIAFLPLAGLGVGILYHHWGKDVEAGNNLLIETVHEPKKVIPLRMAPFVYIGTIATHLFGGSAGREGTAIQMAGAIASQFSKPLRLNESERRILIIAAIAAGFGSVFGTPIAGAIFGLEVCMIGRLKYNAIFPAFASAVIASLTTNLWHIHHTRYHVNLIPEISMAGILYTVIAGIAFGLCAACFSIIMRHAHSIFKSKISFPPLRPLIGGAIISLAVLALGTTKYIGLGIPNIVLSFNQPVPAYDFAVKMIFTIITLAAGFKGGEVTPLFFIGAALGNALSLFIPLPTGLMAGMGFVAVFAGATNTPLACSIMAMELFGSECGVYVALACVVAYLVSGNNSIYHTQIIGEPKHRRFNSSAGKRLSDL